MKRMLIIVGLLLAATALAFWALDLPARFGWRGQSTDQLTLYGNIDIRQVELGFRVAGRIKTMNFEEGETVRAGVVLATLDDGPYQDKLRAAAAQAAQKMATLQKLEAGPRPAEIKDLAGF